MKQIQQMTIQDLVRLVYRNENLVPGYIKGMFCTIYTLQDPTGTTYSLPLNIGYDFLNWQSFYSYILEQVLRTCNLALKNSTISVENTNKALSESNMAIKLIILEENHEVSNKPDNKPNNIIEIPIFPHFPEIHDPDIQPHLYNVSITFAPYQVNDYEAEKIHSYSYPLLNFESKKALDDYIDYLIGEYEDQYPDIDYYFTVQLTHNSNIGTTRYIYHHLKGTLSEVKQPKQK